MEFLTANYKVKNDIQDTLYTCLSNRSKEINVPYVRVTDQHNAIVDDALPALPDFADFSVALLQQIARFLAAMHLVAMELVQVVARWAFVGRRLDEQKQRYWQPFFTLKLV